MKKQVVLMVCGLLAILSLAPVGSARAQDNNSDELAIPPIIVSASRTEKDLMEIPMSVGVVTRKQIEERTPGANTAEKLRDIAGVSFPTGRGAPGNNLMVMIRGQRAWRVLYLIDGIRQASPFKDDINKALLTVDPTDIERIEVIKGPASALYGSDAIGGVVNIITKKGGEGKPIGGRLDFIFDGSNRGYQPHASIYGDTERWSYRISGSYQEAGDRRMAKIGRADNSSFTTESVFGSIAYKLEKGLIELTFNHYDSDSNEMTYRWSMNDRVAQYYPIGDPNIEEIGSFPTNRRDTVTGKLELYQLLPYLDKLTVRAYYQDRDTVQFGEWKATGELNTRLQDLIETYGLSLQGDFNIGSHSINLGFEFVHDDLTNHNIVGRGNPEYSYDATQELKAIYIQDAWRLIDPLTLTVGLRQTWLTTSLDTFEEDPTRVKKLNFSNLVGNAGLVWQPLPELSIRAQYSQGFRTPDLASKLTGTGNYLLPNYDLEPETSQNYELGVRWHDGDIFFDASVFYNKVEDIMTSRSLGWVGNPPHLLSTMMNAATYKVKGVEVAASWRLGESGFTPYGSFTYQDGTIQYEDHKNKNPGMPNAYGTLGLRWDREFKTASIFADAAYRVSGGFVEELEGGFILYRSSSGRNVDLNFGFESKGEKRFKAVLTIKNLLDEEFKPAYYGYPARHAVLSLSYIF
ncbi:MAG: TonB-dependent receptor [Deltaproteobacteria bacterium]|jgi:hemoglobin/transferrin/lactoferrin receptor protein|nr:TonB-dependent receptor [Deltaproteobacteria bacterium]